MTFTSTIRASFALALTTGLALAGCGDSGTPVDMGGNDTGSPVDGGGMDMTTPTDGGGMAMCPSSAPAPMNQMGGCCWRQNNGSMLATPELRLAGLKITAPTGTLSSPIIGGLLTMGFDAETFNWGLQFTGAPTTGTGDGMIKTGYAERNDTDGSFAFVNGTAPAAGGDTHRWDAVMAAAHFDGENVTTDPYPGVITIPVFDSMMPSHPLLIELPIYNLTLVSMPMTEMRSCVGARGATAWTYTATGSGVISAYIRVDDAKMRMLNYAGINATLCGLIAGSLADMTYCDSHTQDMWTTKPDSLCTGTTCNANMMGMMDVCDPTTTCNAWHLNAQFDAQGVQIN